MKALAFRDFSCYYKHGGDYIPALKNLNFQVDAGAFVAIVGASGSGKTTLLKACIGFAEYFEGDLLICGIPIEETKLRDNNCAYVSQEIALYPHLNVYENIAFPLRQMHTPQEETDRRVKDIARQVGLELLLTRKPRQLSVGQQQRAVLARAMIKNPRFLFLDEPFSNIDPARRGEMQGLLRVLHRQFAPTVLFVTHDIGEALLLADRVIVLEDGQVAADGTPAQLREKENSALVRAYLESSQMGADL